MKSVLTGWVGVLAWAAVAYAWPAFAQGETAPASPTTDAVAVHLQQLAAERSALVVMLNDPNTPAEKKAGIQTMLAWNARGVSLAEVKRMQSPPVAATAPPAPVNNLAEAEAAPLPANVTLGGGAMLHDFSKGRDAEASAKAVSSLGLVKAQQGMDSATRESEAKIRDAQTMRNQAGAAALAQRQQDAASAASQQAAGSFGKVLGDSLVQSVQQGAQAAGQAVGGGAAGRLGGAVGQVTTGGSGTSGGTAGNAVAGATTAGASAAAGQIFGGNAVAPGAPGTGNAEPAAPSTGGAAAEQAAVMTDAAPQVGALSRNAEASGKRYIGPNPYVSGQGRAPAAPVEPPHRVGAPLRPATQGLFDAFCPKHGKYGGEIGKVKGCPRCEAEKNQVWDAFCQIHGKYGGRGPVTGCPQCAQMYGKGFIR